MATTIAQINAYLEAIYLGCSLAEAAGVARFNRWLIHDWRKKAEAALAAGETGRPVYETVVDESTGTEVDGFKIVAFEGNYHIGFVEAESYAEAAGMRDDLALLRAGANRTDPKAIAKRIEMRRSYQERQDERRKRIEVTGTVQSVQLDPEKIAAMDPEQLRVLREALVKL